MKLEEKIDLIVDKILAYDLDLMSMSELGEYIKLVGNITSIIYQIKNYESTTNLLSRFNNNLNELNLDEKKDI